MELSEQDKQRIEARAHIVDYGGYKSSIDGIMMDCFVAGATYEHSHLSDLLGSQSKEIESLKEALETALDFVNDMETYNRLKKLLK